MPLRAITGWQPGLIQMDVMKGGELVEYIVNAIGCKTMHYKGFENMEQLGGQCRILMAMP